MKMKINKRRYLYVLQGNYGPPYGFEDLTASETKRDMIQNLRDYESNEGGNYRIIKRRKLNPDYQQTGAL